MVHNSDQLINTILQPNHNTTNKITNYFFICELANHTSCIHIQILNVYEKQKDPNIDPNGISLGIGFQS